MAASEDEDELDVDVEGLDLGRSLTVNNSLHASRDERQQRIPKCESCRIYLKHELPDVKGKHSVSSFHTKLTSTSRPQVILQIFTQKQPEPGSQVYPVVVSAQQTTHHVGADSFSETHRSTCYKGK